MNEIDDILSTALLGTASRKVSADVFPDFMRPDVSAILDNSADYEDAFMKSASMLFACANSGLQPVQVDPSSVLQECAADTFPSVSDHDVSLLTYLNDNGLNLLFRFAVSVLRSRRVVFPAYSLPYFVDLAYVNSSKYLYQYRFALWPLLGARGKWLVESLGLGGQKFVDASHSLRLRMFVAMRKASFKGSASQLGQIWDTASVKQKKEFLSVFLRVWPEDLDFIENAISCEKNTAVKTALLELLQRNPGSGVVKFYMKALRKSLTVDGRRHCDFAEVDCVGELAEIGIDAQVTKDSGLPNFLQKLPAGEVIIFKLIQSVPLSFWMEALDCDAAGAVKFLYTNPAFRLGFDFRSVILRFQDSDWAVEHCLYNGKLDMAFVPFLDAARLDRVAENCDIDTDFRISEKLCGNIENYEPWGDWFSNSVVQHIIRTRNFDPSQVCAQLMASKISKSAVYVMESYVSDNYGNDIVVSFFMRVLKLRKIINSIIG